MYTMCVCVRIFDGGFRAINIKLKFNSSKELGKKGKIVIYFGEIGYKEKQI